MLHLIIILIIDFYSAYLKKEHRCKSKKNKNKIITMKPNNWKKTLIPPQYINA